MDAPCKNRVLLLGDGDFSFTLSLLMHSQLCPSQVITSNLDTEATIQEHALAAETMREITEMGAHVFLEVDAREIHNHPVISRYLYDRIIFNFPLEDRHNIKRNRALLADFFASCTHVLSDCGQVMVTLCKGQGGTPADQPMRSWHNSWQIIAMAANSGFILSQVLPFTATKFPEYHSVGFRFQDKSFTTEGSLTHIFEKAESVALGDNIGVRGSVEHGGSRFSSSLYVADMFQRSLLQEYNNPVSLLENQLKSQFQSHFNASMCSEDLDGRVLLGHKLHAYTKESPASCENQQTSLESTGGSSSIPEGSTPNLKDKKNQANESKREGLTNFEHGISFGSGSISEETPKLPSFSEHRSRLVPSNSELAFVLVKNTHENLRIEADEKVYHLRGSMLESLEKYVTLMCARQSEERCSGVHSNSMEVAEKDHGNFSSELTSQSLSFKGLGKTLVVSGHCFQPGPINPFSLPSHHQMLFVHELPGDRKETTPDESGKDLAGDLNIATRGLPEQVLLGADACFNEVTTCLSAGTNTRFKMCGARILRPDTVTIQGVDQVLACKDILMEQKKENCEGDSVVGQSSKKHLLVGCALCLKSNSRSFIVCVLELDLIACQICKIPDARLLWSHCEKFGRQFSVDAPFPVTFQPCSLYSMKFVHDLSFWEKVSCDFTPMEQNQFQEATASDASSFSSDPADVSSLRSTQTPDSTDTQTNTTFDELEMLNIIRNVAGDIVVLVHLLDRYTDPSTGRASRCYRLHFQSHDRALTYATSWKIQSLIRLEVAKHLNVQLR